MEANLTLHAASIARLTDSVYAILKENILSQKFEPGQRLHLEQLTEQLGVSLTPIKDALNRLAGDGLVEIIPRRGTYVTNPGPKEIADAFEVRCALEVYAIKLTLQRASDAELHKIGDMVGQLEALNTQNPEKSTIYQEFVDIDRLMHRRLVELSGNQRLLLAHDREHTHMYMARARYGRFEKEIDKAQAEHQALFKAMLQRNVSLAQQLLTQHIERAKLSLLSEIAD